MNKIIQGDALAVLKTLDSESIDMVMTSPPYWALRDYGVDGQLGLEPTFQEYVHSLFLQLLRNKILVFCEVLLYFQQNLE